QGQELEADDVDDRVHRGNERRLDAELAQRRDGAGRALGGSALTLQHEGADALVHGREIAMQELLGVMRFGGDERALAELQRRLSFVADGDEQVRVRGPEDELERLKRRPAGLRRVEGRTATRVYNATRWQPPAGRNEPQPLRLRLDRATRLFTSHPADSI